MALTLTPDQQKKLEAFEGDADAAVEAEQANDAAQVTLRNAESDSVFCAQDAVTKHSKALESAQEFISVMLQRPMTPAMKGAKS